MKIIFGKIIIIIFLSMTLTLTISMHSNTWAQKDNYIAFGDYLFKQQEYDRSISEYYRELYNSPLSNHDGSMDLRLGIAHAAKLDVETAQFFLTQVVEQYPKSYAAKWALLSLSKLYFQKRHYYLSMQKIDRLLNLDIDDETKKEAEAIKTWNYLREYDFLEAANWYKSTGDTDELSIKIKKGCHLKQKSPLLGGTLSAIFPGAGHCYSGMWQDGLFSFILNFSFTYAAYQSFNHNNYATGWILTFFELSWYTGNIYTGIGSAHKANRKTREKFLDWLIRQNLQKPNLNYELPEIP